MSKICSVIGCKRSHYARGYCSPHYLRLLKGRPLSEPIRERASVGEGSRWTDHHGYVQVVLPDCKGRISEHRFVMEKHLGRKLSPGENVYHKNGRKDDNKLGNLELCTKTTPGGIAHIKYKICKICQQRKPLAEFYKSKKWYQSYCKICQNAHAKLWRENSRDYLRQYKINKFARMPEEKKRGRHLKHRYGITNEDYLRMLAQQGGACIICKEKSKRKRLSVDHCHSTNTVRGLLCERCNSILGRVDDNPGILESAAKYLREHIK